MISLSACTPDDHLLAQLSDPDGRSVVLPARIWDDKITITLAETVEASADTLAARSLRPHTRLSRVDTKGTKQAHQVDHQQVPPTRPSRLERRLCRDFMARSAPGVDAVSGLGFPLWDIPL